MNKDDIKIGMRVKYDFYNEGKCIGEGIVVDTDAGFIGVKIIKGNISVINDRFPFKPEELTPIILAKRKIKKKNEIVIEVHGGIVINVYSSNPNLKVKVVDHDLECKEFPELIEANNKRCLNRAINTLTLIE